MQIFERNLNNERRLEKRGLDMISTLILYCSVAFLSPTGEYTNTYRFDNGFRFTNYPDHGKAEIWKTTDHVTSKSVYRLKFSYNNCNLVELLETKKE